MPLGPFGEVVGTTGTFESLGLDPMAYKSKVVAPRNPKLVKGDEDDHKVWVFTGCTIAPDKEDNYTVTKVGDTATQKTWGL